MSQSRDGLASIATRFRGASPPAAARAIRVQICFSQILCTPQRCERCLLHGHYHVITDAYSSRCLAFAGTMRSRTRQVSESAPKQGHRHIDLKRIKATLTQLKV